MSLLEYELSTLQTDMDSYFPTNPITSLGKLSSSQIFLSIFSGIKTHDDGNKMLFYSRCANIISLSMLLEALIDPWSVFWKQKYWVYSLIHCDLIWFFQPLNVVFQMSYSKSCLHFYFWTYSFFKHSLKVFVSWTSKRRFLSWNIGCIVCLWT